MKKTFVCLLAALLVLGSAPALAWFIDPHPEDWGDRNCMDHSTSFECPRPPWFPEYI